MSMRHNRCCSDNTIRCETWQKAEAVGVEMPGWRFSPEALYKKRRYLLQLSLAFRATGRLTRPTIQSNSYPSKPQQARLLGTALSMMRVISRLCAYLTERVKPAHSLTC